MGVVVEGGWGRREGGWGIDRGLSVVKGRGWKLGVRGVGEGGAGVEGDRGVSVN